MTTGFTEDGRTKILGSQVSHMVGRVRGEAKENYQSLQISTNKARGYWVFVFLVVSAFFLSIVIWGIGHQLWDWLAWKGMRPFQPFDYITDSPIGRIFEIVCFVTCAVQLRWLRNSVLAGMHQNFDFRNYLVMWMYDCLSTPLITWILVVLLQSVAITFAGEVRLSLAEADVTLYGAVSALLGISVKGTRALFSRISDRLLNRFSEQDELDDSAPIETEKE